MADSISPALCCVALLVACGLAACSTEPPPADGCPSFDATAEPLEIGFRGEGDVFEAVSDGDPLYFQVGSQGSPMILPCLRATGIDPDKPRSNVCVEVNDRVTGSSVAGERVDLPFDGVGNVLWDLRTVLDVEQCCLACTEATVYASLQDARGRTYAGRVDIVLSRGGCPDPDGACENAEESCPAELLGSPAD